MSDSLDPRDDLTERLAALGRQPVAPAVQSQHLTAMASVPGARSFRTSLAGRLKVGAGVFAGFLLGASGLASVGGLGPLQPIVAERAAEVANVDLPQGPKDKAEKAAAKAAKGEGPQGEGADNKIWGGECPEKGEFRNRGDFLKAAKDAERDDDETNDDTLMSFEKARESDCGKGVDADGDVIEPKDEAKTEGEGGKSADAPGQDEDAERGKSAGAPGKSDDPASAGKAKGDAASDDAAENKPESTPAGPPEEGAGVSGITPPADPETETPAEPETPAPAADDTAGDPEV